MAVPASFTESNAVLGKPTSKEDNDLAEGDEVECLSVLQSVTPEGTPVVVSNRKLTKAELEEVNRTGRIWLLVLGHSMPPVSVDGCRPMLEDFSNE